MTYCRRSYCLAAVALTLFLVGIWLFPNDDPANSGQFVVEFVRLYGFVGSADQRYAYLVALTAVAIFSAVSFLRGGREELVARRSRAFSRLGVAACAVAIIGYLIAYQTVHPPVAVGYVAGLIFAFLLLSLTAP